MDSKQKLARRDAAMVWNTREILVRGKIAEFMNSGWGVAIATVAMVGVTFIAGTEWNLLR